MEHEAQVCFEATKYPEAHVNDDTMARNVLDNVVKEVSVNIDAMNKFDDLFINL